VHLQIAVEWITVLAVVLGFAVSSVALGHQGLLTLQKDPKQWVMPNGNYSGWNYSGLDQINLSNVQNPDYGVEHATDSRRA
jgi:hypothetical protein